MIDLDALPYVESPNKHVGRQKAIRLLVMHTPQTPEGDDTAENVAAYFANPAVQASTHLVGDNNSIVRCVLDADTAWGAAGANADGLHYELAGVAEQDAQEWADDYSKAAINLAVQALQAWAALHGIPIRKLNADEVSLGLSGICGHADVFAAYGEGAYRSDPGAAFPWDQFIALVQGATQEDNVQRAIGCASVTPSAYLTDGLTKRIIASFDELEALRVLGLVPNTDITPVTEAVFHAIPDVGSGGGTGSAGARSGSFQGVWTDGP